MKRGQGAVRRIRVAGSPEYATWSVGGGNLRRRGLGKSVRGEVK